MKRFIDYIKKYWWFYTNNEVRLSHEEFVEMWNRQLEEMKINCNCCKEIHELEKHNQHAHLTGCLLRT